MGRIKRFSNRAQLVRYIAEAENCDESYIWSQLERELE